MDLSSVDDEKMTDMVKAVTFIQSMMKEPWVQNLLSSFGGGDRDDAEAGRPAPSRPQPALTIPPALAAPHAETPAVNPKSESTPAAPPAETPAVNPKSESMPPPPVPSKDAGDGGNGDDSASLAVQPEEVINSSTHRQAHARLGRRMQSLGPADCPQMQQLWNGSRKDIPHVCHWSTLWSGMHFKHKSNIPSSNLIGDKLFHILGRTSKSFFVSGFSKVRICKQWKPSFKFPEVKKES